MHWLFAMVRFFPYWALPIALVLLETGVYFKRWKRWKPQFLCWGIAVVFLLAIGTWFFYRGDMNSDQWVRMMTGDRY